MDVALVDYAYEGNFSFVDVNKIGSTGHSMGGNAAIRGAIISVKKQFAKKQKVIRFSFCFWLCFNFKG